MAAELRVRCCIAGGGPAGMMLGFLLARAGVPVAVLEKHADFLRDFRGDTIHPSTLDLMHELGLLEEFLARPHDEVRELIAQVGDARIVLADFRHVPARCKFVAFMPQCGFLDFLAQHGRRIAGFDLRMRAEAVELIEDGGRVAGVRALAGLRGETLGAPMDVLWLRLPRLAEDPQATFGHADAGRIFIMLNRGDYWQCAYVIAKGSFARLQRVGLASLQKSIVELSPFLPRRVEALRSWDDVQLLTVAVDRLREWHRPGLLCIGDAAHAMSLADRRRREWPTRMTQKAQVLIQNRIIRSVLGSRERLRPPLALRLLQWLPVLRRIPARLIGIGLRPEHVAYRL